MQSICKDNVVNMTWGVSFGCCCYTVLVLNWSGTSCTCSGLDLTPRWGYVHFTELPNANTQEMSLQTKDVLEREKDSESEPQEVTGRVCWVLPRYSVKAHSRFSRTNVCLINYDRKKDKSAMTSDSPSKSSLYIYPTCLFSLCGFQSSCLRKNLTKNVTSVIIYSLSCCFKYMWLTLEASLKNLLLVFLYNETISINL